MLLVAVCSMSVIECVFAGTYAFLVAEVAAHGGEASTGTHVV
jgi:hypothetical protein